MYSTPTSESPSPKKQQNAEKPSGRAVLRTSNSPYWAVARQLQLRLQYARLKVEHGWQKQKLNEVENLYFHHCSSRDGHARGQQSHNSKIADERLVNAGHELVPGLDNTVINSEAELLHGHRILEDGDVAPLNASARAGDATPGEKLLPTSASASASNSNLSDSRPQVSLLEPAEGNKSITVC